MGVRFGEREWKQQVEGLHRFAQRPKIQGYLEGGTACTVVDASYGAPKKLIVPTARVLLFATLAWSGPAFAALDPGTLIKLSTSVLKVEVIRVQGGYSLGSGVVVGADRWRTNCHVTRDARQIAVLQGGVRPARASRSASMPTMTCACCTCAASKARAAVQFSRRPRSGRPSAGRRAHHRPSSTPAPVVVVALHRLDGAHVIQSTKLPSIRARAAAACSTRSRDSSAS